MNTIIKETNSANSISAVWCYDVNGNVYVDVNDKFYILEINRQNNLELSFIENDVFKDLSPEFKIKYKKIADLDHSLKKKILEDIEKSDSDRDEEYQNRKKKSKCYEEDKYLVYEDDDDTSSESDNELDKDFEDANYKFYQKGNLACMKFLNKGLETPAIYDTYVRDNSKNVLLSLQSDCQNSYRVSLFNIQNDTVLELNIVGSEIRVFRLEYTLNENTLSIQAIQIGKRDKA